MAHDEGIHSTFWTTFSSDWLILIPNRILTGNATEEIFLEEMEMFKQRYYHLVSSGINYIMHFNRNTFWADVMYLYMEEMDEDPYITRWYQFKMEFFHSQGIPLDIKASVISDMYDTFVVHKPLIKYYIENYNIDVNLPGFYDSSRTPFWSVVMKYGDWTEEDIDAELSYLIAHGATPEISEMDKYRADLPEAYVKHIIQIIEDSTAEMIKEPSN